MNNFILKKIKKEAKELQLKNSFVKYSNALDFVAIKSGFDSYHNLKENLYSCGDNQNSLMEYIISKRKTILASIQDPDKKEQEKEFIKKLEKRIS